MNRLYIAYHIRLLFIFSLLLSCSHVSAQKTETDSELQDLDFAIQEVETNYAGFSYKTRTEEKRNAYEVFKKKLRAQVLQKEKEELDAIGEYFGWFGDFHLRTGLNEHAKYQRKSFDYSTEMTYSPMPIACKVDEETFLIRFPSCDGNPNLEWSEKAINNYLSSECKHLIIDIRGNSGGRDTYYAPYVKQLYDTSAVMDGVDIRNTPEHQAYIKDAAKELPWLQETLKKMKSSSEEFIPLIESTTIHYDTISPLPIKAALIIDGRVASSGEQMVLDIHSCSLRTTTYGRDNTLGCLDLSNIRRVDLPVSGISTWIPMTRSQRLPDRGIDDTGISPDIHIPLPLPGQLTDNVDEWVLWVAKDMKEKTK
ncbi:S41 family peptidase [Bacteroides sp.]|uniref:S41 family peptidase n=1 Tax=Bacteroides sp. TaxID=29523 RepID=UPI003AB4FD57